MSETIKLKFLLVPIGSAGDVLPFVWLAKLLRDQGHEVVFLVQELAADMPRRAGLTTIPWGQAAQQEEVVRNPDIWHPRKAINIITHYASLWSGQCIQTLCDHIEPGRTIIIAGALAFGARVLAERTGIPLLTVHLQPCIFMSIEDSPVMMARSEWLPQAPRWVRRAFFGIANWMVDRKMGAVIEQVRTSVGLPPGRVKGLMRHYWHSPDGVLCLFPDWFGPKASDWPPQAQVTRFPLYDQSDDWPLEPALEAFLSAGNAPIIITPGSANAHAGKFLQQALAACQRLQRRALVLTRYPEQVGTLPPDSASFTYAPFGKVFPRAAAVIHHGGIGTTAQCLAAGVPQLLMPMAHDQPDNAVHIKRMGVGDYLYPRAFKGPRIAEKLAALIDNPAVRQACATYREKSQQQISPAQMAQLITSLATRALVANPRQATLTPSALQTLAAQVHAPPPPPPPPTA